MDCIESTKYIFRYKILQELFKRLLWFYGWMAQCFQTMTFLLLVQRCLPGRHLESVSWCWSATVILKHCNNYCFFYFYQLKKLKRNSVQTRGINWLHVKSNGTFFFNSMTPWLKSLKSDTIGWRREHRTYIICKTIPVSVNNFLKSLRLKFEGT